MTKLYPDDEGGLQAACFIKDNHIVINFGKSVKWLSMHAQDARVMGHTLLAKADQLDGSVNDSMINDAYKPAMDDTVEKIRATDTFVAMCNGTFDDPLMLMQMGVAIFLDKPIMLVVNRDTPVPENLKKVAQKIEYADWSDPEDMRGAIDRVSQ